MLGKPWFLLLVSLVSLAAGGVFLQAVTAAADQIVVDTYAVASTSLLTGLVSLGLLFAGCAIRSIGRSRPSIALR